MLMILQGEMACDWVLRKGQKGGKGPRRRYDPLYAQISRNRGERLVRTSIPKRLRAHGKSYQAAVRQWVADCEKQENADSRDEFDDKCCSVYNTVLLERYRSISIRLIICK